MVDFNCFLFDCNLHIVFNFSNDNSDLFINSCLVNENGIFLVATQFNFKCVDEFFFFMFENCNLLDFELIKV